ncbi:Cytochrome d ubiquinol oxidase subunit I [Streptomyces xiamenensis]|uniref:Cytochrome d ubiquinol oxidase subunit I n=1 Tax=Streptomyces xiamenensis TaxID=408015 RepID=A0A0F7FWS5_9ACTN|nr:hypothetical protein [Streptomyces xiamenensis]AKG44459.1 Cytochrome d ubiquinol oxidase subunit I [Streptomyces xiamenensis]
MDPQTLDLARWQFGLTAALFVTVVFGGLQLESLTTLQPMKSAVFRREAEEVARLQAELTARFGPGDHLPNEALTRGAGPLTMPAFALLMYGCRPRWCSPASAARCTARGPGTWC